MVGECAPGSTRGRDGGAARPSPAPAASSLLEVLWYKPKSGCTGDGEPPSEPLCEAADELPLTRSDVAHEELLRPCVTGSSSGIARSGVLRNCTTDSTSLSAGASNGDSAAAGSPASAGASCISARSTGVRVTLASASRGFAPPSASTEPSDPVWLPDSGLLVAGPLFCAAGLLLPLSCDEPEAVETAAM